MTDGLRRSLRHAALAALIGVLGGCAALLGFEDTTLRETEGGLPPDADGGTTTEGGPNDAGTSAISVKPASPVLRRGGALDLSVDIVRSAASAGELSITLSELPSDVTAAPATLPPGISTGIVKLTATAAATLGPTTTRLTVTGATLPSLEVPLLVADPAGTVDVTFDGDGVTIDATKGLASAFYALALASDGAIVAGGAGNGAVANAGWLLRRFSAAGVVDAAFTAAVAPSLPTTGELRALAIDGAGKLIAVGASTPPPPAVQPVLTVARFTATGALDTAFGGGIVRIPNAETPLGSTGYGVAVQANGSIVVVGSRKDAGPGETGLALRFLDNGTRDPTFNGGATVTVADTRFVGVAVEASGNVVLGGTTTPNTAAAYVVARRTSTGAPDATFGTAGVATFGTGLRANAFVRTTGGPFALAGDVRTGPAGYSAGIVGANGTPLFAKTITAAAGGAFNAIAAPDDATLIAAGNVAAPNGEARIDRILADGGVRDPSFGDAGTSLLDPGANGSDLSLYAAVIQKDGRILVAGNRSNAGAVVYRLWP
ncbi:MAG: hypothetical protein JST00_22630 [Deltaproteobacteria bacterium]|nr:hypothetical protein [Deltaproteobacteria bacterium]